MNQSFSYLIISVEEQQQLNIQSVSFIALDLLPGSSSAQKTLPGPPTTKMETTKITAYMTSGISSYIDTSHTTYLSFVTIF